MKMRFPDIYAGNPDGTRLWEDLASSNPGESAPPTANRRRPLAPARGASGETGALHRRCARLLRLERKVEFIGIAWYVPPS
jgi:hypothetical protein